MHGIGVLDPTCGSGTFLLHAARRLLSAKSMQDFRPEQQAEIVTRLINGMDIHPVAVEMARVNLERILPARPSMGHSAFQIYWGDSLKTDRSGQEILFGSSKKEMTVITPKGRNLSIPISFIKKESFADDMRQMVNAANENRPLPDYLTTGMTKEEVNALKKCHTTLAEVIAKEGNSVWTWYVINTAAPYLLSQRKVDRVVANPPWVKLADIQVPRRKETMEEYGRNLGLFGAGKQAPHYDIASYFIVAVRRLYMASPKTDPAAWLVKKSAISAGQWEPFRKIHCNTLKQSVDLENLQPFGGGDATRSCLLMEHRSMRQFDTSRAPKLEAKVKSKSDRPKSMESLKSAIHKFNFDKAPEPLPIAHSKYLFPGKIKQGATLVPHVLAFISEIEGPDYDNRVKVTTQRSTKHPWKNIPPQTGIIPSHWVRPVLASKQMITYIPSLRSTQAIIPIDERGKVHRTPCKESFWLTLDEIYESNAGIGKGTPKSLLEQFDFQNKLSGQFSIDESLEWMLLYPGAGDIMRAARVRTGTGIVDSSLFWLPVHSMNEAGYLVALLNAACLRRAFKESRESGRSFQLHPWRKVPIPLYNKNNRNHVNLADLCTKVENIAKEVSKEILDRKPNLGQVGVSKAIRNEVYSSNVGQEIEAIVTELLPEHATTG